MLMMPEISFAGVPAASVSLGPSGYATAESLGGVTGTTSFADMVTLSTVAGQLTNGATYLIFWSIEGSSTAALKQIAELVIGGSTVASQSEQGGELSSPADNIVFGGFAIYTAGTGAETFKIQAKKGLSGGTTTFSNARISFLKLGPDDFTTETLGVQSTTATSLQTAATLTFTPASTGNYIILATFLFGVGGGGTAQGFWKVGDGTTDIGELRVLNCNTTGILVPVFAILPLASVSGSKSVTVRYRSNIGLSTPISEIRIVAIREDRFTNIYKAILGVSSSGTEATYQTALTQTFTPAAADHLTLASMMLGVNSTTESVYARFVDGGTTVDEAIFESNASSAVNPATYFSHRIAAYAASSRTQAVDRKAETTATTSAIIAKSAIVTFDLTGIT